jgi:peptidoglycan/xylan/chitin deacetylase (PgdA/CDA1 family)
VRRIGRSLSRIAGKLFSLDRLYSIPSPIFLPFYHIVSDRSLHYRHNYHYRGISQFEKELELFLKHLKPVSLDYLLSNPNSTEKVFHLSFDDGLKECAEIIAPILLKKGIPATFFINPDFIDNKALFHRYKASLIFDFLQEKAEPSMSTIYKTYNLDTISLLKAHYSLTPVLDEIATLLGIDFNEHLREEQPYMRIEQLEYLSKQGFTIGAHSMNHPEFWKISVDEQYRQIKDSLNWVKNGVNPEISSFSFPFTDDGVSGNTINDLHQEKICNLTFGTAGIKYDSIPNHFQRYPVEQEEEFEIRLKEEWIYLFLRKIIHKETVKRAY